MTVRRSLRAATLLAGSLLPLALVAPATASAAAATPTAAPPPPSLCAPPSDTVGPAAESAAFGRSSIDLQSASRVQTMTVDASDTSGNGTPSGVAHVRAYVVGARFGTQVTLQLTSGTSTSGTWTGSFEVSKYAHPGTYSITDLYLVDAARNTQDYYGNGSVAAGPNSLTLHPADAATFQVTGTPATPPPLKPSGPLTAFSISPSRVNTVSSARTVHLSARFGTGQPKSVSVNFSNPDNSGPSRYVYLHGALHLRHGVWSGTVTVPRWLGKQDLQPGLEASYGAGHRFYDRNYDADQLYRSHFANNLAVVSGVDRTLPTLTSLALSPDPIDSTTGAVRVTVTARATDTGSGVQSVTVSGGIRNGVNGAVSGSYPFRAAGIGYQSSDNFTVRLTRTANGTWVGSTVVRKCVPSGTYTLDASVGDIAGNERYYATKQLAAAHLTSTVQVTSQHGDVVAPYVYSAATYGADHEMFLNFSEGVARVTTSTLSVFALSPAGSRYRSTLAVASIVCSDGTNTVDCSGSGGLATSAVLVIPDLVPGQKYEVWGNLNQVVPQLIDGNGNPLDWNYAATEVVDA